MHSFGWIDLTSLSMKKPYHIVGLKPHFVTDEPSLEKVEEL